MQGSSSRPLRIGPRSELGSEHSLYHLFTFWCASDDRQSGRFQVGVLLCLPRIVRHHTDGTMAHSLQRTISERDWAYLRSSSHPHVPLRERLMQVLQISTEDTLPNRIRACLTRCHNSSSHML